MGVESLTGLSVAGSLMSTYGAAAEGDAALAAGEVNAQNSEFQAKQAAAKALEDEATFRRAMRSELASNEVSVAASGVKLEGSPLAVLNENARNMDKDASAIRTGALTDQQAFSRAASRSRASGR